VRITRCVGSKKNQGYVRLGQNWSNIRSSWPNSSNHLPTTELLKAKLKSREKVEKYTAVITGYLIKHGEKLSKLLNNIG
jgi:hypothetical protein